MKGRQSEIWNDPSSRSFYLGQRPAHPKTGGAAEPAIHRPTDCARSMVSLGGPSDVTNSPIRFLAFFPISPTADSLAWAPYATLNRSSAPSAPCRKSRPIGALFFGWR